MAAAGSHCFPSSFAHGDWLPSNSTPAYALSMAHAEFGHCRSTRRDTHDWRARAPCRPPPVEVSCARLVGQKIVMVGDSTLQQVFYSIASMFMKTQKPPTCKSTNSTRCVEMANQTRVRRARVACGHARVEFVYLRNDLLVLPEDFDDAKQRLHDHGEVKPNMRHQLNFNFAPKQDWRAENATLTVFSGGLHDVTDRGSFIFGESFLADRLRIALRTSDPARTAVAAVAAPLPDCTDYHAPLTPAEARQAFADAYDRANASNFEAQTFEGSFVRQWERWREHTPRVMHSVAAEAGVAFLDFTRLMAMRPDSASGQSAKAATIDGKPFHDCVHHCMPVRRAPQRPPRFACPGAPRALCPS